MRAHIAVAAFLVGITALMATACNPLPSKTREAYDAEMEKWIGKSTDELKVAWGLPAEVIPLRSGLEALRYKRRLNMGFGKGTFITIFEVNADATIVKHYSQGPACKARPKINPR